MRLVKAAGAMSLVTGLAAGCQGPGTIDRTQPNKVQKCIFFEDGCETDKEYINRTPAEYFYAATVIDVPATSAVSFVGEQNFGGTGRIVWDIQEKFLFAYQSFPWIESTDPDGHTGGDEYVRPGSTQFRGAPLAAFPITSHFDVKRNYNPTTGEQTNVLMENTQDRPWYDRDYIRVDWSKNNIADFRFKMTTVTRQTTVAVPEQDDSHDLAKERAIITPEYIDIVQHIVTNPETIPGTEGLWGWKAIPECLLLSSPYRECVGGTIKVRNSFMRVPESSYKALDYSAKRFARFGYFDSQRYAYNPEYGVVESDLKRFANRWNVWKDASCHNPEADHPYGACSPEDVNPIVYHVSDNFPDHLRAAAKADGEEWNRVWKEALQNSTGWDDAKMEGVNAFIVCENNPVKEGDPAECGEPGLSPQLGDMRYSMYNYVGKRQQSSPLGYGPSLTDPLTGEIIAATANFYGDPGRWLTQRVIDIYKVSEGMLTPEDIGAGLPAELSTQYYRGLVNPSAALDTTLNHQVDRARAEALTHKINLHEKAQRIAAAVQDGTARHDTRLAKLAALRDSPVNQMLVTEDLREGLGIEATSSGSSELLGPTGIDQLLGDVMFRRDEMRRTRALNPEVGGCLLLADEVLDERYLELINEIKDKFGTGDAFDEQAAQDWVEQNVMRDTQLHEIGHTVGLRHNFAASTDAINFGADWWALRAFATGTNESGGLRPNPEWAISSDADYRTALGEGLRSQQSASTMDYMSTFGTDTSLGAYDRAAIQYAYYDTIEVFDNDDPNVNITPERAQLLRPGALHYTYYPEVVSDAASFEDRVAALYARKYVNYRKVDAAEDGANVDIDPNLVAVPYRFCSDEYAGGSAQCERWDQGVDNYERTVKRIADYDNYFWFDSFKRGRVGWGLNPFSYLSRIYNRKFKGMLDQYKNWLNEELIIRRDDPCLYYENGALQSEDSRFTANACGFHGYTGAIAAFNLLAKVVQTPNIGCYTRLEEGCYETAFNNVDLGGMGNVNQIIKVDDDPAFCDTYTPQQPSDGHAPFGMTTAVGKLKIEERSPYIHLGDSVACAHVDANDPTSAIDQDAMAVRDATSGDVISMSAIEIPLGEGRPARTIYSKERYGYDFYNKPIVMGSWWDKWMAIKAMNDPYTDFIGVDASSDTASYLLSFGTLFGENINEVIAGIVIEDTPTYGPAVNASGDGVRFVNDLSIFTSDMNARGAITSPWIDPDQEYTFRLLALANGAYQTNFIQDDVEVAESLYIGRSFSDSEIELPADIKSDPARFVSLRDPVNGKTYWAVSSLRYLDNDNTELITSAGFEYIKKVKDMYYVGGSDGPGLELLPWVAQWQVRGEIRIMEMLRSTAMVFGAPQPQAGDVRF